MTKQEKIKQAYGEYWDIALEICDDNGWIKQFDYYTYFPQDKDEKRFGSYNCCRPKSLQGIETNNGWIKIESEKDLPSETMYYHVINKKGKYFRKKFLSHVQNYKDKWRQITHYQPIIIPQPPMY